MKQKQRKKAHDAALYDATTDPALIAVTTPLPRTYPTPTRPLPQWQQYNGQRVKRTFMQALIDKINKLLGFTLILVFLLLLARFLFTLFSLTTSLFSQWVFVASQPLITPFEGLLPTVPYQGYPIAWSVLCAFVVYTIAIFLVSRFLKLMTD